MTAQKQLTTEALVNKTIDWLEQIQARWEKSNRYHKHLVSAQVWNETRDEIEKLETLNTEVLGVSPKKPNRRIELEELDKSQKVVNEVIKQLVKQLKLMPESKQKDKAITNLEKLGEWVLTIGESGTDRYMLQSEFDEAESRRLSDLADSRAYGNY